MTSTLKSAISLDTSALVDTPAGGPPSLVDAADVNVPFGEVEGHLETARERVSVTVNDTHMKHLSDAISVGSGLTKTIVNPAGDEQIQLDSVNGVPGIRLHESTVLSGSGALPDFLTTIAERTGREWLLVARLRSTFVNTSDELRVYVKGVSANVYYTQEVSASNTATSAVERIGTSNGLIGSGVIVPADLSQSGAYAMLLMHLFSEANNGMIARWRLHSPLRNEAVGVADLRWLAGTAWCKEGGSGGVEIVNTSTSSWAANSGYWLYEFV